MKVLTVIIPVYNAELFIKKTIEKVQSGIVAEKTLVIINDCSTDNTINILNDLSIKYNNIIIIDNEKNIGPGESRNIGLQNVFTEYVIFFDCDDYLIPGAVDYAIGILDEKEIDLAIFTYIYATTENFSLFSKMMPVDEDIYSGIFRGASLRIISVLDYPKILRSINYPWNKIYKTKFIKQIDLRFPDYRLHEDIVPHWHSLISAKNILLLNKPVCYHYVPSIGLNATNNKSQQRLDVFFALNTISEYFIDKPFNRAIYTEFLIFTIDLLIWVKSMLPDDESYNAYMESLRKFISVQNKNHLFSVLNSDRYITRELHSLIIL